MNNTDKISVQNISNSNPEIECYVLGCLLSDNKAFTKVFDKISLELFTLTRHQRLFALLEEMYQKNIPATLASLNWEMKKRNLNFDSGYIINLISSVSSTANLEYHVMILVELQVKRDFIRVFSQLIRMAQDKSNDIFDIRDQAFQSFDNLFIEKFIDRNRQNHNFKDLIEKVQQKFEGIEQGVIPGIYSSLKIIRKAFGGWQNSDLTIVASRPGMGKTSFMVQAVIDVVTVSNSCYSAGIFSLEMGAEQIAGRVVTNLTGISNSSLLRKGLSEDEKNIFKSWKETLKKLNIHIDDTAGISIDDLRVKAKMMKLRHNIDILFVDYLQLMTAGKQQKNGTREQEIAAISRGLKAIAKELNLPIIALSQLSREVEKRADKRPMLSDLRDSGSIEQDADEVIFIYRPEYYGFTSWEEEDFGKTTEGQAELIIAKNRHGGTLNERCGVDFTTSRFFNLEEF
jgi:replicative DNA helicase